MGQTSISKTLGPIHFEDLDPGRFEDLVRELAYDFRDWQNIEATGRSGSDDGFDIRAFERTNQSPHYESESDGDDSEASPDEGRVWMFQCKREKEIGPSRVASIVADTVDAKSPPYGYVLAAPANFSKKSYDRFRDGLRQKGVMEFYLWGKAALEDMLHLPKNDRILFTFFGISLVSRRRSRATEIRATVTTKNKLFKVLGDNPTYSPILLRDSKDSHYPYNEEYPDFESAPRWREYPAVGMHPLGILVDIHRYFAFYDSRKGEWDYTKTVDLVPRQFEKQRKNYPHDLREMVEDYWEYFAESEQAKYAIEGLVRFDSIIVIDPDGDSLYRCPHLFVDFQRPQGPFAGYWMRLELAGDRTQEVDKLKRVSKFPVEFPAVTFGKIYRDRAIVLDNRSTAALEHFWGSVHHLHVADDRYDYLMPSDVISIEGAKGNDDNPLFARITKKRTISARELLKDPMKAQLVESQIGRQLQENERIKVFEFRLVHAWRLSRAQSGGT